MFSDDHLWNYPGTLSSLSSHCNAFEDRVSVAESTGTRSSRKLRWPDSVIGYHYSSSSNNHQLSCPIHSSRIFQVLLRFLIIDHHVSKLHQQLCLRPCSCVCAESCKSFMCVLNLQSKVPLIPTANPTDSTSTWRPWAACGRRPSCWMPSLSWRTSWAVYRRPLVRRSRPITWL